MKSNTKWPGTPAQAKAPPGPGIIRNTESPGCRTRVIVIGSNPGIIVIAGAVDYRWPIDIAADISGGIPYIDHIRRRVINMDILGIINRTGWWYLINPGRCMIRHCPWSGCSRSNVPDSIFYQVKLFVSFNHRL